MAKQTKRTGLQKIIHEITLPFRALFAMDKRYSQLSLLREERMDAVAPFCSGKVLDVGCGPGNIFIKEYIGQEHGIGIDVFPYEDVEIIVDMTSIPFPDSSFDTITLIAVGGHIPKHKRVAEFQEFARLLKPGGLFVMTEGEPITQWFIHQWNHFYLGMQGLQGMDDQRGMEQDEEYCMPTKELRSYLHTFPLQFVQRKRFFWGLNNVYIAKKVG